MLLLIGKSGSGKDTIMSYLIKFGMKPLVRYTSRPMRDGEIDGVTYHFLSKFEFEKCIESGFLFEYTSYVLITGEKVYYGSAVSDMSDDVVMITNPSMVDKYRSLKEYKPVVIYISARWDIIYDRLNNRGDNAGEIERRMNADDKDFLSIINSIDFMFSNDMGMPPDVIAKLIYDCYSSVIQSYNIK